MREEGWRIGVDIGGTFTDLVIIDAEGVHHVFKVQSVPETPVEGVVAALEAGASALGMPTAELLAGCDLFMHGSTIATNTLLERQGATVGMLCTDGFRDSLEIRRGMRQEVWEHRAPYPDVLVPRHRRQPVRGRVDRNGTEIESLALEDVRAAARQFQAEGVEAVAVCFLNSFLNPEHEQAALAALEDSWGGEWITASHDVAPIMGEYERGSTVVLNAYVAPRSVGYVRELAARLGVMGLNAPLLLIQNNGGAIAADSIAGRPATLLLSGPAAGVGALRLYRRLTGSDELMSMEIGGTSCDAMLMSEGEVGYTDLLDLSEYHLALPSVDLHTIGAGGGTIAGVDDAGMLFVGPRGAGADPGPACYGRGGEEPTITDAQLVLGRLEPNAYAGGAVVLDKGLAEEAVNRWIAQPLSLTVDQAAQGVIRLMEQKLLHAMQRISVQRGHDPRRFTLVASGGAGPLHGTAVAHLIGCPRVYIPRLAGAFCALGMLHSDVRHDFVRVYLGELEAMDPSQVVETFDAMEAEGRALLEAEGFAPSECEMVYACDLRYQGQQWDVRVTLDEPRLDDKAVRATFEGEHERLFGHIQPAGVLEVTKLRLTAIGIVTDAALSTAPPAESKPPIPTNTLRVWIDTTTGWIETPFYQGKNLQAGHMIEGPAIVKEATTTIFVGARDTLSVDTAGNYSIEVAQ